MRVYHWLLYITCFSLIVLSACTQAEQRAVFIPTEETLRDGIRTEIEVISWADEFASEQGTPGALLSPPTVLNAAAETVPVPQGFPFIAKSAPVYPFLTGFGSLNTSALDEPVIAVLNKLLEGIQSGGTSSEGGSEGAKGTAIRSVPEDLFSPSRLYARRIFLYELRDKPAVTSWRYGEPFFTENTAEVPVRLYTAEDPIDLLVFLTEESEEGAQGDAAGGSLGWLIDQIHFTGPIGE
ncbi:MAG: hypothetical protein LBU99_04975 [Spirochaetaceae bacterium]|jgi:hypothetical protein|nr:hypothetical protein [Spirochaetaceae bacterium]